MQNLAFPNMRHWRFGRVCNYTPSMGDWKRRRLRTHRRRWRSVRARADMPGRPGHLSRRWRRRPADRAVGYQFGFVRFGSFDMVFVYDRSSCPPICSIYSCRPMGRIERASCLVRYLVSRDALPQSTPFAALIGSACPLVCRLKVVKRLQGRSTNAR